VLRRPIETAAATQNLQCCFLHPLLFHMIVSPLLKQFLSRSHIIRIEVQMRE
jgi:hypothetical protein